MCPTLKSEAILEARIPDAYAGAGKDPDADGG
jgi:hypothetical protein